MHEAARDYIAKHSSSLCFIDYILEIGGRDINGGLRDLWPNATWISVDPIPGPGVDIVGDFRNHKHPFPVDLIICCEVFEHTEHWRDLIKAARTNLSPHGTFLVTTATGNRKPHSGIDGNELQPGEYYQNIDPKALSDALKEHFTDVSIDVKGADVRATAQSPAVYDCSCGETNIPAKDILDHRCPLLLEGVTAWLISP